MDLPQRGGRPRRQEGPPQGASGVAYHGIRVAILLAVAMATYALFPASPAVETPVFEVGAVATENVIAPFAFTVPKSDAELAREREELARTAEPIFVYTRAGLDSARSELDAFMDSVAAAVPDAKASSTAVEQTVQRAAAAHGVMLTAAEADYLTFAGRRRVLHDGIARVYERWLAAGIAPSGAVNDIRGELVVRRGTREERVLADSVLTFGSMLAHARRMHPDPMSSVGDALFIKLLTSFFHPTLVPDQAATEARRDALRASVSTIRHELRAGEKIVGEHEVVGRAEHEKLRALQMALQARAGTERAVSRIAGAVLYNALVLALFGVVIALFRPPLYASLRALSLFALLFLLVLLGAALGARVPISNFELLVPVALAAIVCSVLFDPRISLIAAVILAVLVGGQSVYRGTNALFLHLIGGATAAFSVRVIRRRDQWNQLLLGIAVGYALACVAIGLSLDWDARMIGRGVMWGGVNALVSVMLAMILLPLAERFTRITTDLTLLEYSDLNRPLLRRLSLEAPGTYAHTIALANLVEAACNAIGANGLLARVGTYYHDIGKLRKPQYFAENQARGRNPHDKLTPNASAAIIRDHVREGLALAAEHKLPAVIARFIPEHHGTGPITYFLDKARERDGAPPNAAEFSYPGPVPQSVETAVCLLADGVEASMRVLQDPTPAKIREVIEHIVRLRMEQGQLRDAPLTLKQLDIVKEQFARVLVGMHHNRIDYPAASGGITAEFASV